MLSGIPSCNNNDNLIDVIPLRQFVETYNLMHPLLQFGGHLSANIGIERIDVTTIPEF